MWGSVKQIPALPVARWGVGVEQQGLQMGWERLLQASSASSTAFRRMVLILRKGRPGLCALSLPQGVPLQAACARLSQHRAFLHLPLTAPAQAPRVLSLCALSPAPRFLPLPPLPPARTHPASLPKFLFSVLGPDSWSLKAFRHTHGSRALRSPRPSAESPVASLFRPPPC